MDEGALALKPEDGPVSSPPGATGTSDAWERVKLARHPQRPYTLDYLKLAFADYVELHGDRRFADDQAIVGGLASLDGRTIMVIGHQKGRDTKENVIRHFGMPRPEGYRKALRLMRHAERFDVPILTLIDRASGEARSFVVNDVTASIDRASSAACAFQSLTSRAAQEGAGELRP